MTGESIQKIVEECHDPRAIQEATPPERCLMEVVRLLFERQSQALNTAFRFSQIDGAHHKAWSIDQMVLAMTACGNPEDSEKCYLKFVERYENGGEYKWDKGTTP